MAVTAIAVAALTVALAVYRPFDARPFEFLDFPEFFGILEGSQSLADQTRGLAAYYKGHGRANLLAYALVATRWTLFGHATAAWQVTRFAVMCALIVTAYFLLRRLGSSRPGAIAGASLFLTTEAAARGWLRLSMMEPLATLLLLLATLLAARFQRSEHWARNLMAIAVLVAAAILTKEVAVAATPLVALVGLLRSDDDWLRLPERSQRNLAFVGVLALASSVALLPTAAAVSGARATAYAASYGVATLDPGRALAFLVATLVPFDPFAPNAGVVMATVGYVMIGLVGLTAAWKGAKDKRMVLIPLAIALVVPLGGAIAYLPWPSFELFYTIPYLVAPALLIGLAVTAIERRLPRGRWVAYTAVLCMSLYALSRAHAHARRTAAAQRLVDRTAIAIAHLGMTDSVVFAVRTLHPQAWQGTGPTVARYATAIRHLRFPPVTDLQCERAFQRSATAGPHWLLVVLSSQCVSPFRGDSVVQEEFRRWDWNQLRFANDWLRADLIHGKAGGAEARPTTP